jgi:RimJ/RimL family protein N-acetyltransferase
MTQPIVAPLLETERLLLRPFHADDFDSVFDWMRDPVVSRYLGGAIESRSVAWEKFLRGPAFWVLFGYGLWAVERKKDGAVIGQIGFGEFVREITPPLPDIPEMAWIFAGEALGQGYGTEALAAVLAWGDAYLGGRFQCIISPQNEASMRLAARFGFAEVRRPDFKGEPIAVLERVANVLAV